MWRAYTGTASERALCEFCFCCFEQNIIHRDLKPANIIRKKNGDCVIVDFGLSKDTVDALGTASATGVFKGTKAYSAPEVCCGTANIVKATDVFALGVIFYEVTVDLIGGVV